MLFGHHRIAERIVLVVELDDRAGQGLSLLDPEAFRQRPGGDVANHDLDRDDLHLPDQLLAHVEAADEVGRHADGVQGAHDVLGDAVVQHPLAVDHVALFRIEGGGVVLEILDEGARLRTLIEDLRLAFIDHPAAGHGRLPERRKRARHSKRALGPAYRAKRRSVARRRRRGVLWRGDGERMSGITSM